MLIRRGSDLVPSSEITPESLYLDRRRFLKRLGAGAAAAALGPAALAACEAAEGGTAAQDAPTPYEDVTGYNNYYEFGTGKGDPKEHAQELRTSPWTVKVDGMVRRPARYALEDLLRPHALEDRVYRHRCVEGWSMVVPWLGFPLRDLLARVEPDPGAKFVEFTTLFDPAQMPGQRVPYILKWPYVEALRLDEAMHPLTLLVTGLYGKELPNQNGAPLRLVVPWKYGFKGCKAIVRIRLTDRQPVPSWVRQNPREYGFYANVNPDVDHPRWSQRKERRIGEWRRRDTLMFNGYADQVAHLYAGMDLRKNF